MTKIKINWRKEGFWRNSQSKNTYLATGYLMKNANIIRAGNSLIRSYSSNQINNWAIRSDCSRQMSESLRLLRGNERPWANRSDRSRQMSDHERFAQVAQRKWANEGSLKKICLKKSQLVLLRFKTNPQKISNSSFSLISSFLASDARFAQVAQRKWAMWARSFCSPTMSKLQFFLKESLFLCFWTKNAIRSEIKWANSQPWT